MKAVYARISDDAEGTGLGVARQLKDCHGLAALRGWEVGEYVDNDVSAYKRNVRRPEFERMLADLETGAVDGVVVYNLDRLARQPSDLERLIAIYEEHRDYTFATLEGDINLSTGDGLTMARVMTAFANKASIDTGRRTRDKHRHLAEQGEPVGRRMFGWQDDKRSLDPDESEKAREVVRELLAGAGVRDVVRRLNDVGITTTTGGAWSHQTLRKYLRNPRLVGLRTRYNEILLNDQGQPVRGTWEPLLDQETYDQLQELLDGRKTPGTPARRGARKYLLTGLLRCGICNGLMFGSKAREDGRFNYVCNVSSKGVGERHTLAASGTSVDKLVSQLTLEVLLRSTVEPAKANADWAGETRLAMVRAKVDELMGAYDAGTMPGSLVFPRVQALQEEVVSLQDERSRWLLETQGPVSTPETYEKWAGRSLDERRSQMDKLWVAIYVRPAKQRSGTFDASRLDPVPREGRPVLRAVRG